MDRRGGSVYFNSLNLNRVDTASGVFIGTNIANGWRSSKKSNEGFGHASGCLIYKTINMVFDDDNIDTVIYDTQENNQMEATTPTTQHHNQTINFKTLNVNALNINASINMGDNRLSGWRSHSKANMGFGNGTGTNIFVGNTNVIDDQDIVDSHINDANNYV
jgi:hypothetical protein